MSPFAAGIEDALAAEGYLEVGVAVVASGGRAEPVAGQARGLEAADLTGGVVERFFDEGGGRRCQRRSRRSLKVVLNFLASLGVVASSRVGQYASVGVLLPDEIAERILSFGEWRMGAHRVVVTLRDGSEVGGVVVAWGREIVRVDGVAEIPFDAADVVAVFPDSS